MSINQCTAAAGLQKSRSKVGALPQADAEPAAQQQQAPQGIAALVAARQQEESTRPRLRVLLQNGDHSSVMMPDYSPQPDAPQQPPPADVASTVSCELPRFGSTTTTTTTTPATTCSVAPLVSQQLSGLCEATRGGAQPAQPSCENADNRGAGTAAAEENVSPQRQPRLRPSLGAIQAWAVETLAAQADAVTAVVEVPVEEDITLDSLSLCFDVSRARITRLNNMTGRIILTPTILVPLDSSLEATSLANDWIEKRDFDVPAFIRQTGCDPMTAKCYLNLADDDLEKALQSYLEDVEWEQAHTAQQQQQQQQQEQDAVVNEGFSVWSQCCHRQSREGVEDEEEVRVHTEMNVIGVTPATTQEMPASLSGSGCGSGSSAQAYANRFHMPPVACH